MNQQYRPAKGRANWATFFLALYGVIAIASILSTIAEIGLLQRIDNREFVSNAEIAANDRRLAILGLLNFASFIAAAVAFLAWIRRASANLAPLGVRWQRFSPGWAVGAWFVPIVCLFRPYQIMAEIWRDSLPEIAPENRGARGRSLTSPMLGFWWAAWLVSGWISNLTIRFFFSTDVDDLIRANLASIVAGIISLAALILAVILVRRITSNQGKKHAARQTMIAAGVTDAAAEAE